MIDRRRLAQRTLFGLIGIWWVLFGALFAQTFPGGGKAPDWWHLPAGVLVFAFGLHLIAFRREDSELFSRGRARWGIETASQSPTMMVVYGIFCLALRVLFISAGVISLVRM